MLMLYFRFTPEQLGVIASSALVWLFVELVMIIASMYVIGILSNVKYLDLLALCGYKYVGYVFLFSSTKPCLHTKNN